jgi:ABC-type dipeptide/oligopeptide/nickel transport system ATPase subunit
MIPAAPKTPRGFNGSIGASTRDPARDYLTSQEGSPISEAMAPKSAIVATDVTFSYGTGPAVVKNVSLTVPEGGAIGIVGESGSGKTTLASLLIGMLIPTTGTVTVKGRHWSTVRRRDPLRRAVQMVFQNPYTALNPRFTALQTVAEVYQVCGDTKTEAADRAEDLLKTVGLSGVAIGKRPGDLSGGQCQRVGIARALAADPTVIVADEPTSALDVSVQAQILNLLNDLRKERGVGLVLISHDLNVVSYLTERAIVMERGNVVEQGVTADLLHSPTHPYTQGLIASIL